MFNIMFAARIYFYSQRSAFPVIGMTIRSVDACLFGKSSWVLEMQTLRKCAEWYRHLIGKMAGGEFLGSSHYCGQAKVVISANGCSVNKKKKFKRD